MLNFNKFKFKRNPYGKQLEALKASYDKPYFALFMEQGTGKTKVTLDTVNYLYLKNIIDTLIVVAWPNGVHRNWVDIELSKDLNMPFKACAWKSVLNKEKKKEIEDVYNYKNGLRVITYNIESVITEKVKANLNHFIKSGKCILVIDQSACIKNPSAARTKALLKLSTHPNIIYKRILDGDPVAEGTHEIFAPFKFLDPSIINIKSYAEFKVTYCVLENKVINNRIFSVITGSKNQDQLKKLIAPYSFICTSAECVDLPERIYKKWIFDLSSKERKCYDELKQFSITLFNTEDGEELVSHEKLALVKNMRLQQITSGLISINNDDGGKSKLINIDKESSRLSAFKELIKQTDGKVLIFARFRHDIKNLETLLGDESVSYYGGISDDNKANAKTLFMNDDKIKYFIGNPTTAGIGHTLTAAKNIVFYNNNHSLRLRKECEKRVHRIGLKHSVIIWDLIANKTQDLNIIKAFETKQKISDLIMKKDSNFFDG